MDVGTVCFVDVPRKVYARTEFGEMFEEGITPYEVTDPGTVEDAERRAVGEAVNVHIMRDKRVEKKGRRTVCRFWGTLQRVLEPCTELVGIERMR